MELIWAFNKMHTQDGTNTTVSGVPSIMYFDGDGMDKHPNEIMLEKIERYNNPPKKTEDEIAYEELMKKVKEKNDEKKNRTSK